MMLRKFGFKKSEPRESEARLKLQKELFAYTKVSVLISVDWYLEQWWFPGHKL